ncbi:Predicted oxidoreductase, contains short-chain dehydrogenase (SDR) and DUF2520 domains [Kaistella chaponensis]|uniref:Predicted oxidoreductase, contains short-chain dehydrogenase (SDR) and DUF2520 domains n=1 Tax=Kaistella chaponensis TaxID=713588 RepID=A0A1N7LJ04_9FLAO|nr:Rossmann-like and DUF2520 domain-containing protein [Kaistella chaponensis]SIS73786.1 Predicted oxidoreductase, contains short-chain dehydrogenase (SDR) and DUF2520 domains [Kaistella chaponensis]
MKIAILGSGNVAYHLAKMFKEKNIPISQIFGRNEKDLQEISEQFEIPFSTTELADAELYFIAVNDDAVAAISKNIKNQNSLVAHTSGSLPKEILEGNYRKASFYPLQTFSKSKMLQYSEIPFFVEAENEADSQILENLALKISEKVMKSDYEKRKYIHLTAVFACNFVNHLFARAKEISDSQHIPFDYFLPLIKETTLKIEKIEPKLAQTGPAIRNDEKILQLHEALITEEEHLKIYQVMNESIKKMYEL